MSKKDVAIVMGSDSDYRIMKDAVETLNDFKVSHSVHVLSAHRTPQDMLDFAHNAAEKGYKVIIAGAGGAAHLPGMIASATTLPTIGVPVQLRHLDGLDSLLSIVQMPKGVPVATVSIDNATNAALLAMKMLAISDKSLAKKIKVYQDKLKVKVRKADLSLKKLVSRKK